DKARTYFGISGPSQSRLAMFDVTDDHSALTITNENRTPQVVLGSSKEEGFVRMSRSKGEPAILFTVHPHIVGLGLADSSQKTRLQVGLENDRPVISLFDAENTLRSRMAVFDEGPVLQLKDGKGQPVFKKP